MVPLFRNSFPDHRLIVVSNREPYEHRRSGGSGEIEVKRPAGGLTSALDPLLQALGGVWIAWGSGDADREVVDAKGTVRVPPERPSYTLRRLWLDSRDVRGYYLGYANQVLWPICHLIPSLTRLRARNWERYRRVNQRFADAVLEEADGASAAVWFQDYHLALAPALVRARRPDLTLAHFWHIPWPPLEILRVAPQAGQLLEGLLATDVMGFQTPSHVANFLNCAEAILGATVDRDARTATHQGHTCHVRAFPISIDVEALRRVGSHKRLPGQAARLRERYLPDGGQLAIGVDRADYSKGLPEKLKAVDLLLERYPEFRERFALVQVAVPSRADIEAYEDLMHKVERQVWEINDRFGTARWRPVHLIKKTLSPDRLAVLFRAADVCMISSLQDGMNLVAKEFVASRVDGQGVLLLSSFTGAAEDLDGAILVNPYDPEGFARRLREALLLPPEARSQRMQRMQASLRTIFDWMAQIFDEWSRVAHGPEGAPEGAPETAPGVGRPVRAT